LAVVVPLALLTLLTPFDVTSASWDSAVWLRVFLGAAALIVLTGALVLTSGAGQFTRNVDFECMPTEPGATGWWCTQCCCFAPQGDTADELGVA
jgi:hypothetical protein